MIVRVARISGARTEARQRAERGRGEEARLTDGEVREGLVDGQHVARGAVRGLFGGLEVVVRDDVVVRVDALAGRGRASVLRLALADWRRGGTTYRPLLALHRAVYPAVLLAVRSRELAR